MLRRKLVGLGGNDTISGDDGDENLDCYGDENLDCYGDENLDCYGDENLDCYEGDDVLNGGNGNDAIYGG